MEDDVNYVEMKLREELDRVNAEIPILIQHIEMTRAQLLRHETRLTELKKAQQQLENYLRK